MQYTMFYLHWCEQSGGQQTAGVVYHNCTFIQYGTVQNVLHL